MKQRSIKHTEPLTHISEGRCYIYIYSIYSLFPSLPLSVCSPHTTVGFLSSSARRVDVNKELRRLINRYQGQGQRDRQVRWFITGGSRWSVDEGEWAKVRADNKEKWKARRGTMQRHQCVTRRTGIGSEQAVPLYNVESTNRECSTCPPHQQSLHNEFLMDCLMWGFGTAMTCEESWFSMAN